jgi:hypothetical protein
MTLNPIISNLGRRLRLAVIGGGPGSFIGAMHRQAARLDDRYELVAGVLSSNSERAKKAGTGRWGFCGIFKHFSTQVVFSVWTVAPLPPLSHSVGRLLS